MNGMSFIYSKGALLFSYLPLIWIPRKYDSDSNNEKSKVVILYRILDLVNGMDYTKKWFNTGIWNINLWIEDIKVTLLYDSLVWPFHFSISDQYRLSFKKVS